MPDRILATTPFAVRFADGYAYLEFSSDGRDFELAMPRAHLVQSHRNIGAALHNPL